MLPGGHAPVTRCDLRLGHGLNARAAFRGRLWSETWIWKPGPVANFCSGSFFRNIPARMPEGRPLASRPVFPWRADRMRASRFWFPVLRKFSPAVSKRWYTFSQKCAILNSNRVLCALAFRMRSKGSVSCFCASLIQRRAPLISIPDDLNRPNRSCFSQADGT